MQQDIGIEDRIRLQDLLAAYAWANDSANLEGVVGVFTPDGTVQASNAGPLPVRKWATETFLHPGRRGRQHWVQPFSFEPNAARCAVRSYWKVLQWLAGSNTKAVQAMGYYEDICVKADGHWRIKEKRIYRCNDETPLPW